MQHVSILVWKLSTYVAFGMYSIDNPTLVVAAGIPQANEWYNIG